MFNDSAIVRFYSYIDGSCKLMRVKYSCDDNGTITLGDVNEVHITYEDISAIEETGVEQTVEIAADNSKESDEEFKDAKSEEQSEPDDEEKEDGEDEEFISNTEEVLVETTKVAEPEESLVKTEQITVDEGTVDAAYATAAVDAAQVTNAEVTVTNKKVSVDDEQNEKEDSSATSFAESERAELEALKREKKLTLLDSYKEHLTEEEYADFTSRIDSFE